MFKLANYNTNPSHIEGKNHVSRKSFALCEWLHRQIKLDRTSIDFAGAGPYSISVKSNRGNYYEPEPE